MIQFLYASIILLTVIFSPGNKKEYYQMQSPDKNISVTLHQSDGELKYSVKFNEKRIIVPSRVGIISSEGDLSKGIIKNRKSLTEKEIWKPLYGANEQIQNYYQEETFAFHTLLGMDINIRFRIYNDGVAFRYEFPEQPGYSKLVINEDLTEFIFKNDYRCRLAGENVEKADYQPVSLSEVDISKVPVTIELEDSWLALAEASVFDFSMMYLTGSSHQTGLKSDIGISQICLPGKTPWRVIMMSEEAGGLIESDILVNLNEPSYDKDFSWIKPGKSLWDWRNIGYVNQEGFRYGQDETTLRRMIDFSSGNNIDYILFDAGWYGEKGPLDIKEGFNVPELIRYADKKDVGVILYVDRQRKDGVNDWDLEVVLRQFNEWGVAGVKYGFLSSEYGAHNAILSKTERQKFVNATWDIVRACARNKLLVNFHDNPLHLGGELRTWPNLIVKEYCHAQQDARLSFGPFKAVSIPFVNGLLGPLDLSNGFYDLDSLQFREKVDKNGLNSTLTAETARCLINYSPLMILPDNGDEYQARDDIFYFIRKFSSSWDESKVLAGEPGEFIVVARRKGEEWFLAAITNENSRKVKIPLDFLDKGRYNVEIFKDRKDTHYIKNKESYEIEKGEATEKEILNIWMAPGGGFCMIMEKQKG